MRRERNGERRPPPRLSSAICSEPQIAATGRARRKHCPVIERPRMVQAVDAGSSQVYRSSRSMWAYTWTGAWLPRQAPRAGEVGPHRTLTVGICTYDDFDGTFFTIMSLRLYRPEVADRVSIPIVDNNPCGRDTRALRRLEEAILGVRYVPVSDIQGTAGLWSWPDERISTTCWWWKMTRCSGKALLGCCGALCASWTANPGTCAISARSTGARSVRWPRNAHIWRLCVG